MPEPIGKAVALIDGKEVEVAIVKPGEGLLAESDFQTRFETRFGERATSLKATTLSEALKDEAFRTQALKEWKIDPTAKPGKTDADIERRITEARTQWETSDLAPIRQQFEGTTKELDELRGSILDSQILEGARKVHVKDEYLTALGDHSQAMIVAAVRNKFGFDPKTKEFYVKDAKGEFVFSSKPVAGRKAPYMTVSEYFETLATSKEHQGLIDPAKARQSVGGTGGQGGGHGGVIRITRADARVASKFRAAEEEAKKINGKVEITD